MAARQAREQGRELDESVRTVMLSFTRAVGRIKRQGVPPALLDFELAPRHFTLLSLLLLDGPTTVNELAAQLEVAPTTVSLMVSDLGAKGIVDRVADPEDRRRRIVSIAADHEAALAEWLAPGTSAWRRALAPLTASERTAVVRAITDYEAALGEPGDR